MVCLINLLNPELVILGGGVVSAHGQRMLDTINRIVRERALPPSVTSLRVELSTLQEVHWAMGASLLVAEDGMERVFALRENALSVKRRRRLAGFPAD